MVQPSVLPEMRACLLETERYAVFRALTPQLQNPFVAADARVVSAFTACNDLRDLRQQIRRQYDRSEKRFAQDDFSPYRQSEKKWKPFLRRPLILYSTVNGNIGISVSPVRRNTERKPQDPFGDQDKMDVRTCADDLPCFLPPRVRLFQKETDFSVLR